MTPAEFDEIVRAFRVVEDEVLSSKGREYTRGNQGNDRLFNFKRVAEDLDITSLQAVGVYWHKHLDSVFAFIKEGTRSDEPIETRVVDAINYLYLLYGVAVDLELADSETLFDLAKGRRPEGREE